MNIIYKCSFPNGKSYIGITDDLEVRKKQHYNLNNPTFLTFALNEYKDQEQWQILEYVNTREEAIRKEKEYIFLHNTKFPRGYNRSEGGETPPEVKVCEKLLKFRSKIKTKLKNEDNIYYGLENPKDIYLNRKEGKRFITPVEEYELDGYIVSKLFFKIKRLETQGLLISLLWITGGKVSEIINLKKEDIMFDCKYLIINIGETNNKKRKLIFEINKNIFIENIIEHAKHVDKGNYLLGKKYTSSWVRKTLTKLCRQANINLISAHHFRHKVINDLISNHPSLYEVLYFIGTNNFKSLTPYVSKLTYSSKKRIEGLESGGWLFKLKPRQDEYNISLEEFNKELGL